MPNGKQVRLSQDTMKQLNNIGKPFESVDDCLQRVLSCDCVSNEMKKQNKEVDEVESET